MTSVLLPVWGAVPVAALLLLLRSRGLTNFLLANPGALSSRILIQTAGHLLDFGFIAVAMAGLYHFGRKILKRWGPRGAGLSSAEVFLFSTILAEHLFGYLIFGLGLAGFLRTGIFLCLYALLSFGAAKEIKGIKGIAVATLRIMGQSVPLLAFLGIVLGGAAVLRIIIATGSPPTDWDSLGYHLAFPKIFLTEGRLPRLAWSINAHYPLNTEMLYTFVLSLRGDLAVQWLNLFHGALLLFAVHSFARRYFGDRAAFLAAGVFLIQPVFQRVSGNAATDLSVAAVSALAIMALIRGCEAEPSSTDDGPGVKTTLLRLKSEGTDWFLLSGIFSGMAMSSKITGTWMALSLSLVCFIQCMRRSRARRWESFVPAGAFLVGLAVFGSPWYLKNLVLTGNPVWPYLGQYFGATGDELAAWFRIRDSVTEGTDRTFLNLFLLPVSLILRPELFLYRPDALVGPFLILLVIKLLHRGEIFRTSPSSHLWEGGEHIRGRFSTVEKLLFAIGGIFTLVWFVVYDAWRYYFAFAGFVAVLVGAWTDMAMKRPMVPRLAACIAFSLSLLPLRELNVNNEAFAFFALKSRSNPSASSRDIYLSRALGPYYDVCRATAALPDDSRLFLFRDDRGYYIERDYVWGNPLDPGTVSYAKLRSSNELYAALRAQGFTHILFNPYIVAVQKGDRHYYIHADRLMRGVLSSHSRPMMVLDGVGLYRLL